MSGGGSDLPTRRDARDVVWSASFAPPVRSHLPLSPCASQPPGEPPSACRGGLSSILPLLNPPLSSLLPSPHSSPLLTPPLSSLLPSPHSSPLLTPPLSSLLPSPHSSPLLTPPLSSLLPSPHSSPLLTPPLSSLLPSPHSSPLLTPPLSSLLPSPHSSPLLTPPLPHSSPLLNPPLSSILPPSLPPSLPPHLPHQVSTIHHCPSGEKGLQHACVPLSCCSVYRSALVPTCHIHTGTPGEEGGKASEV